MNNEYESILETTTLAMATSTDDDDNDEAKTFTFSEYVRPKSKTTTTATTAATNQTATSASEDRSMIGGGGPDSTSLSTFSNLSSSALSNSFDQPAKAQPALLPLPLSHFSRPSNPSTDTDLDQDNFQDNGSIRVFIQLFLLCHEVIDFRVHSDCCIKFRSKKKESFDSILESRKHKK